MGDKKQVVGRGEQADKCPPPTLRLSKVLGEKEEGVLGGRVPVAEPGKKRGEGQAGQKREFWTGLGPGPHAHTSLCVLNYAQLKQWPP